MSDLKSAIVAVKSAYDIAEYARMGGANLTRHGTGKWKMLCPFHKDSHPSLILDENWQNYRCWACGAAGDIISLAMHEQNMSFAEALRKLAEDKGIEVDLGTDGQGTDYGSLYRILEIAAGFYMGEFSKLPESHPAVQEIAKRDLPADGAIRYGYAPSGNHLAALLTAEGFSDDLIAESGVCRRSESTGRLFDFFRSRLLFIFTDRYGKPIGFSSRKLYEDDKLGKYVNSAECPIFHKSKVLYNHLLARKSRDSRERVYITEGQFDVAAFVASGMENVVAASGTAFTKEHAAEVKRIAGKDGRLVFCFDGDAAGAGAAMKVFLGNPEIHDDSWVVVFPEGQDPCDYRMEHGPEALREYVSQPVPLVEFVIRHLRTRYDVNSVTGRAKYVQEAASVVRAIPKVTLREACVRLLSLESMTPVDAVREVVLAAEPMRFETYSAVAEEVTDEGRPEVAGVPDEERLAELAQLTETDDYHNLAARFIALGLSVRPWRPSVVRSRALLPEGFRPFIDEVAGVPPSARLFPEMFTDSGVARLVMEADSSPFYRLMSREELKEHFIYLHACLQEEAESLRDSVTESKIREMLASDDSGDAGFFRRLMAEPGGAPAS